MVPLLHCLIGSKNNLLDKFCDVIDEFIEKISPDKFKLARALTKYNLIIIKTVKKRDTFDEAPEGKTLKSLQVWLASCRRTLKTIVQAARTNNDDDVPPSPPPINTAILHADILMKEQELMPLMTVQQEIVDRSKQTRRLYSEQQKNLCVLQSSKAESAASLEMKLFKMLKGIGVKQSSYHGGSLNGEDIKKVINNATYLFGEFSLFLKLGKRDNCELSNKNIHGVCHYFQTVFVLWDGVFSFARKINPMEEDVQMYGQFVGTAVTGHVNLGLTITLKVHLMLKLVW